MFKKIKSFLLENKTTRQTVAKNTLWLGIGTVASRFIKAIIIIYAARVLGAENYGIFSYALSLAALFSMIADLGIGSVLTREISHNPESLEKNVASAFGIKLLLTAASVLLVAGVAPFFSALRGANSLMPIAALLIAFDSLRDFSANLTRAWQKMEIEAVINIATGMAITAFGLLAIWVKPTPMILMIGYAAGSGLGLLVAILLLGRYLKNFWRNFDRTLAKGLLIEAMPLAVMTLLGALTVNTDTVMIGWLRGSAAVGLYSASLRPILLIYMLPALISGSTFPLIAKYAKNDDARVRSILEKIVPASLMVAIPLFVGGAILAPQIVSFLFGAGYTQATSTFAAMLFTVILIFPNAIISNTIFAYGEQKVMMYSAVIAGISNVIFDLIFIRPFGIIGSAIATIISQSFAYGLVWIKLKRINNFKTLKHLKRTFVSTAIMSASTFAMSVYGVRVLPNIALSALIYLSALLIMKEKIIEEAKGIFNLNAAISEPDIT